MTEAESERLSRNLTEVIDDLYRQHAPPRDHERLIQLVQVQIRHAMSLAERSARRPGAAAMTDIPHDHLGQPDLQALGDLSVGHKLAVRPDRVADAGGEGS